MSSSIPRTLADLEEARLRPEYARRLLDARVLLADYDLIRRDFPQLSTARLVDRQPALDRPDPEAREAAARRLIDRWLLENAALVSEQQCEPNEVNTPLRVSDARILVCRPPLYGRSFVADLAQTSRCLLEQGIRPVCDDVDGLLDLKGTGIGFGISPVHDMHGDGLMPLGEALEELWKQLLIARVLQHAGTSFATLPAYAVLDPGFDLRPVTGPDRPGGIMVRRATRRLPGNADLPYCGSDHHRTVVEIEMLLRHYGITSGNSLSLYRLSERDGEVELSFGDKAVRGPDQMALRKLWDAAVTGPELCLDTTNVQLTRGVLDDPTTATLVDFSHYRVERRFERPILSLVRDRPYRWGGALHPRDHHFVQPLPELALACDVRDEPVSQGGPRAGAAGAPVGGDSRFPGTERLAVGFRTGEFTGPEVHASIVAFIDRACARLGPGDGDAKSRAREAAAELLARPDVGLEVLQDMGARLRTRTQRQDLADLLQLSVDVLSGRPSRAGADRRVSHPAQEMLARSAIVTQALSILNIDEELQASACALLAFRALVGLRQVAGRADDGEAQPDLGPRLVEAARKVVRYVTTVTEATGLTPQLESIAAELESGTSEHSLETVLGLVEGLLGCEPVRKAQHDLEKELPAWTARIQAHVAAQRRTAAPTVSSREEPDQEPG